MNANLERGRPYRWKPGESGNPGGRPKRRPISDRYEELADLVLPETERIKHGLPKGATYGDALVLGVFKTAIEGRTGAAREIREAIEGKSQQRLELSAPESRETVIRVVYEKQRRDRSVSETEQISGLTDESRAEGLADSPK